MAFGEDTVETETFLDVETGDAVEPKALPAGEYKIHVVDVRMDTDKNGHPYMLPRFEIVGEPTAKDFTRFHGLPHPELTEKQLNSCIWDIGQFKKCFGIPDGKVPLNEMIGSEGWALLGMKDNQEYGEQNTLRKYILPK